MCVFLTLKRERGHGGVRGNMESWMPSQDGLPSLPTCPPCLSQACSSGHQAAQQAEPTPAPTKLCPIPQGPLGLERTGSSLELFRSSWEFKAPFTGGEKKGSWPTRNSTALRQYEVERGNCRKYTLIPLIFTK